MPKKKEKPKKKPKPSMLGSGYARKAGESLEAWRKRTEKMLDKI